MYHCTYIHVQYVYCIDRIQKNMLLQSSFQSFLFIHDMYMKNVVNKNKYVYIYVASSIRDYDFRRDNSKGIFKRNL